MGSKKSIIAASAQEHLERRDWDGAIQAMEELFTIDRDPLIRVRIGDIRRKRNEKEEAMREYIRAAELFAAKGFVAKALAQYKLALSLDSANPDVSSRMETLRSTRTFTRLQREPREYRLPQPFECEVPQYAYKDRPVKLLAKGAMSGV